ncbi:DUF6702 family protein [Membranihabitans maritimus]|uniref:DUF6702 family protein n=1 Tax=Membranihabitans maritimus TaxID=2904244 RepID=UPI001F341ECC|nr:DUF6702 family protein [Membranihabitans maritimus]
MNIIFPPTGPHPIHISKTSIQYTPQNNILQITSHIFIDDLEYGISGKKSNQLFFCTNKEVANADSLISAYIKKHLVMEADGQKIQLTVLGKERSDDYAGAWIYIESKLQEKPHKILIYNNILLNTYSDQKNILNFFTPDKSISRVLLFDKNNIKEEINIKS